MILSVISLEFSANTDQKENILWSIVCTDGFIKKKMNINYHIRLWLVIAVKLILKNKS